MRKLCFLSVISITLSGCLVTPDESLPVDNQALFNDGHIDILVSGFVPNKSLPVVVKCQTDTDKVLAKFLPSQSPTMDKKQKAVYAFSETVSVPSSCFWYNDYAIDNDYNHPRGFVEWSTAQLAYSQEVTRKNGTTYLTYQNIINPSREAAQCALREYTTKGTFAAVMNNCTSLVDWNRNGVQFLQTQYRVY